MGTVTAGFHAQLMVTGLFSALGYYGQSAVNTVDDFEWTHAFEKPELLARAGVRPASPTHGAVFSFGTPQRPTLVPSWLRPPQAGRHTAYFAGASWPANHSLTVMFLLWVCVFFSFFLF